MEDGVNGQVLRTIICLIIVQITFLAGLKKWVQNDTIKESNSKHTGNGLYYYVST